MHAFSSHSFIITTYTNVSLVQINLWLTPFAGMAHQCAPKAIAPITLLLTSTPRTILILAVSVDCMTSGALVEMHPSHCCWFGHDMLASIAKRLTIAQAGPFARLLTRCLVGLASIVLARIAFAER